MSAAAIIGVGLGMVLAAGLVAACAHAKRARPAAPPADGIQAAITDHDDVAAIALRRFGRVTYYVRTGYTLSPPIVWSVLAPVDLSITWENGGDDNAPQALAVTDEITGRSVFLHRWPE